MSITVSLYAGFVALAPGDPLAGLGLLRAGVRCSAPSGRCSGSSRSPPRSAAAGLAFGYWILLPRAIHLLTNYDNRTLSILIQASTYYSFVVTVLLGIVVIFQLPLVILGLVALGVLSSRTLRKNRRLGYLITAAVALALPGPDLGDDLPRAAADVGPLRGLDLARRALERRRQPRGRPRRYSERPMARGAVKAKQAQKAKAQPAPKARARGRRKHASGGNPNQQLFFVRMRRRAKPAYFILAFLFALTFAFLGIGSGSGGLEQLFTNLNIFHHSGTSVSKALKEVDKHPKAPQGFRDLATAYEAKGDTADAISALQDYTNLSPKDVEGVDRARRPADHQRAGLPHAVPERVRGRATRRARSGHPAELDEQRRKGAGRRTRSSWPRPRR